MCELCSQVPQSISSFTLGNVESQLKTILGNQSLFNSIKKTHQQLLTGILSNCDVYSGSIYRNFLKTKGMFDISIILNADGFKVFNSSRREPWGIFATINELPFEERLKPYNILLLGIYHGNSKPKFNNILQHIVTQLNKLSNFGFEFMNQNFKVKCLQNCCDKPARSSILCLSGHRSKYPCIKCLVQQSYIQIDSKSHYFVPVDDAPKLLRDNISFISDAIMAKRGEPNFGVKDFSKLLKISEFNPVSGSIIDQLHCVGGIGKKILNLFIKKYPLLPSITKATIKMLKPPKTLVSRLRDLEDFNNFKSHEFRTFYLYYGPIILSNTEFIEKIDLEVVKAFNEVVFLSNQMQLSNDISSKVDSSVNRFIELFKQSFGEHHLTINLHELVHLGDDLRFNGSGFSNSCYIFENLNGILSKFCHGTGNVDSELFKRFYLYSTSIRMDDESKCDKEILDFINENFDSHRAKKRRKIGPKAYIIGKFTITKIPSISSLDVFFEHKCLYFNGLIFSSESHDQRFKYCNHYIYNLKTFECLCVQSYYSSYYYPSSIYGYGIIFKMIPLFGNFYEILRTNTKKYLPLTTESQLAFFINPGIISIPPNYVEFY